LAEQYGIFDIQSTFQHIFRVLGGFAPDTTGDSVPVWTPLVTEPTLLSPSGTNSWLRPWYFYRTKQVRA